METVIYKDSWKCRYKIRRVQYPEICKEYDCPEYREKRVEQEGEAIPHCNQGPEGTLKTPQFRRAWENLAE